MDERLVSNFGWFLIHGQRITGTVIANFNGYITVEDATDFTKQYDIKAEQFHTIHAGAA